MSLPTIVVALNAQLLRRVDITPTDPAAFVTLIVPRRAVSRKGAGINAR